MFPLRAGPLSAQLREYTGCRCLSVVIYTKIQLLLRNKEKLTSFSRVASCLFEESELHLLLHNHRPLKPKSPCVRDPAWITNPPVSRISDE